MTENKKPLFLVNWTTGWKVVALEIKAMTVCQTTKSVHPYRVLELWPYLWKGKRLRNVINGKYKWSLTKTNA